MNGWEVYSKTHAHTKKPLVEAAEILLDQTVVHGIVGRKRTNHVTVVVFVFFFLILLVNFAIVNNGRRRSGGGGGGRRRRL